MNTFSLRIGVVRVCVLAMLLIIVLSAAKLSDEELAIFRSVFVKIANVYNETCAYTQTVHEHEMMQDEVNNTTVYRVDPILRPDSPREVLSVNGQAPIQRETKPVESSESGNPTMDFRLSTNESPRDTQEGGASRPNLPPFAMEDMKIVSKEDDIWTFEAPIANMPQPPDEALEEIPGPLKGITKKIKMKMQLEVHAPTSTPSVVRISLIKPFRIMLVVRISKMEFAMIYGSDPNADGLVMKEMNMEMSGRAFWKRIFQKQRTTFTEFDCSDRDETSHDISAASSLN